MKRALFFLSFCLSSCLSLSAAEPQLAVTAGTAGVNVTTAGPSTWRQFAVTGGTGGTYQILWAESNGTSGGIYTAVVSLSAPQPFSGSAVAPPQPPPPPDDFPVDGLAAAVRQSAAAVDPAAAAKMAAAYAGLAAAIDGGTIRTPMQLQLATVTQVLAAFPAGDLAQFSAFTAAVNDWLNRQQAAGKLSADRMDRYARAYRAAANAINPKPQTQNPQQNPKAEISNSPCANGHCPAAQPQQAPLRWRWR